MPELPEVEVVKRSLENLIINSIITNIQIKEVNLIKYKNDDVNGELIVQ